MIKHYLYDEKGSALPIAILVMIIVISYVTAMFSMSNTETRIASNDYDANKAFYLADSGFYYVMDIIDKNSEVGKSTFTPVSLNMGGGKITVKNITYEPPAKWAVHSVGMYNNIKKEIIAKISLKNNQLDQLKEIQIGLPSGATIDLGKKGSINDVVYYGVPDYIALYKNYSPTIPVSNEYDAEVKLESSTDDNIVYKYQGNLMLKNIDIRYKNKKILYIQGDLEINSNTTVLPQTVGQDFLMIIVSGDVSYKLSGSEKANIDCVLVANTITFDNHNAFLEGVLVANNIIISNPSITNFFDYKASVVKGIDLSGFLNTKYQISNWKILQ